MKNEQSLIKARTVILEELSSIIKAVAESNSINSYTEPNFLLNALLKEIENRLQQTDVKLNK